jgi:uncharacterized protein
MIDAHVHVFPPEMVARREDYLSRDDRFHALYRSPGARMATVEQVVTEMDERGVERALLVGFSFSQQPLCRLVNDYVLAAVARYPDRLGALACVTPGKDGAAAELERCLEAGLRGCGELALESWAAVEERRHGRDGLDALAALLQERGLPLLVHASEPVGHEYPGKGTFHPAACLALAQAYPGLGLVLAHLGGGLFLYETMPEVRQALARVFYDTAAVPFLYTADIYQAAISSAGREKFIFGSDYPLVSTARYQEALSRLAPEVREAVEDGNARRVYGL